MSKSKSQGTNWESAFVQGAHDAGLAADRLPEGGMRDAGDVWIGDTPKRRLDINDVAVIAWKRLVQTGGKRRAPDGITSVVVMDLYDFYPLALLAQQQGMTAFVVECKATERLNVTRVLHNAKLKLLRWKRGKAA